MLPIREALLFKTSPYAFIYGAVTLQGFSFQRNSTRHLGDYVHHISTFLSEKDSVCPPPFSLSANKGITFCFLFLPVLRCFNSRRASVSRHTSVSRFGHLGFKACMQLAPAFHSLPCPSSESKPSYPSNSLSKSKT